MKLFSINWWRWILLCSLPNWFIHTGNFIQDIFNSWIVSIILLFVTYPFYKSLDKSTVNPIETIVPESTLAKEDIPIDNPCGEMNLPYRVETNLKTCDHCLGNGYVWLTTNANGTICKKCSGLGTITISKRIDD